MVVKPPPFTAYFITIPACAARSARGTSPFSHFRVALATGFNLTGNGFQAPLDVIAMFGTADAPVAGISLLDQTQLPDEERRVVCSTVDAVVDAPNVQSILFDEHTGSFLVGAAAALKMLRSVVIKGMEGLWVEAGTFERLCADGESQAAVLQWEQRHPAGSSLRQPVRYRPCPSCGKFMNRVNFGRISGVDPLGIGHLNASFNSVKTTWCEYVDFVDDGCYWTVNQLCLVPGVPTCLRCMRR